MRKPTLYYKRTTGGGYGGAPSRGGPPAPTRGGAQAPSRGGYSQAPAAAPGRGRPSGGRMGNPGPAPSKSDYVDCPYCSRRFNEKAAELHINFCKEQTKRVTSKWEPSQQEKARAAAKTYVPPKPKLKGSLGDAPDSPMGMGGGYGGAPSRGGPPAPTRGGAQAPSMGGYSQAPAAAPGRGGPSGGRMGNPGPAPSKSGLEHSKSNNQNPQAVAVDYTHLDAYFKNAPIPMTPMELDLVKTEVDKAVKGLRNLGNTCYMNSTIQCLSNTSPLVRYFITDCYKHHTRNNLGGRLLDAFANLVKELWSRKDRIDPRSFKDAIGRYQPMFAGYAQQDSHELLSCLMYGLHEGLNEVEQDNNGRSNEVSEEVCWQEHKLHNQSILVELFHGQFKTTIRCNSCNKETAGFQIFMYLFLPIPEKTECSLDDCLKDFSKERSITGDCLTHSKNCRNNSDTIMKQEICKLPHILIITLRRFANEGWGRKKINADVHFETSGWNLSDCVICLRPKYNLYAVTNHYGTLEGGHYTACCKNPVNQKWYTFNDEHVSPIAEYEVKTKAAYVLYYTSIDQQRYNPASALLSRVKDVGTRGFTNYTRTSSY